VTFNYKAFKAEFRELAHAYGIDPERGATEYQAVLVKAETRATLHHKHMRDCVRAVAERQKARGVPPSDGPGFFTYDADARRYVFDQTLVDEAEAATWWELKHAKDWQAGRSRSNTEGRAFAATRHHIEAASAPEPRTTITLEDMGDALREVLVQYPTQAEMNPEKPQKQKRLKYAKQKGAVNV
jgi:hypothetical protein